MRQTSDAITGLCAGYSAAEWGNEFDPSLTDFLSQFPEAVLNRRVSIASCDSGLFTPSLDETLKGWTIHGALAISPILLNSSELPMPGFDEWYVYEKESPYEVHRTFVNQFGFSPLDSECAGHEEFWLQVERLKPLHVLGVGTPMGFFVTRDSALFKKIKAAQLPSFRAIGPAVEAQKT